MEKTALIGLGRWGKNILRELSNLGCEVTVVLHSPDAEKEALLTEHFPSVSRTYMVADIVKDPAISHVCIATPMKTHFEIARPFASAGKRVFLEKPITDNGASAKELVSLFAPGQFMVGHIFLYHESFGRLKQELAGKTVRSVTITKTSRSGESANVSWPAFLDAFIHETSVLVALFGLPKEMRAGPEGLYFRFGDFEAQVRIEIASDRKVRRFEFQTGEGEFVWNNEDLYKDGVVILSPGISALRRELDVFLNRFEEYREEIGANNAIAVECVRILEEEWLRR